MKRKNIAKAVREQSSSYRDTWKAIEDTLFSAYGCLLPSYDVTITLILNWTKEETLGLLKREGKIKSWTQDKTFEEGNNRKYIIPLHKNLAGKCQRSVWWPNIGLTIIPLWQRCPACQPASFATLTLQNHYLSIT